MLLLIEDPDLVRAVLLGQRNQLLEFHGRLMIRLTRDVHKEVVLVLDPIHMHKQRIPCAGAQ